MNTTTNENPWTRPYELSYECWDAPDDEWEHSTELTRDLFERSDFHRHIPERERLIALQYAPRLSRAELIKVIDSGTDDDYITACISNFNSKPTSNGYRRYLDTVGKSCTPGKISSHVVEVIIKRVKHQITLPEVEVWKNPVSYVTRVKQAEGSDLVPVFLTCMRYCYRYDMPVGGVVTAFMRKTKMKWPAIEELKRKAEASSMDVKTVDEHLVSWFTESAKHCNTLKQVKVLVEIYREAATYTTSQPDISKLRISEKTGMDRKGIRNVIDKLEKIGLLEQGPESMKAYDHAAGRPVSNTRILNLNPLNEVSRWWMDELAPAPDRSAERKTIKERRRSVLLNNGYWMGK